MNNIADHKKFPEEIEAETLSQLAPHPTKQAIRGGVSKDVVTKCYEYGVLPEDRNKGRAEIELLVLKEELEFELHDGGTAKFKFIVCNHVLGIDYGFTTWNDAHHYANNNTKRYKAINRLMGW